MKFKLSKDVLKIIVLLIAVTALIITYEIYTIEKKHSAQLELYRQTLFENYDESIKREVQTVISQVEAYYERFQQGLLSEEEAKELAKNVIRDASYGDDKSGVFWADTFDCTFVASSVGNTVEGADRSDVTDSIGNYFVRTFVENAQKQKVDTLNIIIPVPRM